MWYYAAIVIPVELVRWLMVRMASDTPHIDSFCYQDQHIKIGIKFSMLAGTMESFCKNASKTTFQKNEGLKKKKVCYLEKKTLNS